MKKELTELEIAQKEIEKLKRTIDRKDKKIGKLEAEIETYKIRKMEAKRNELIHQIKYLERIQRERTLDPIKVVDIPKEFNFSLYDAIAALSYAKDETLQFASIEYNRYGEAHVKCVLSYGYDSICKKYGILKNFYPNEPSMASLVQDIELPGFRMGTAYLGFVCNNALNYECNDPNAIDYVLRAYQSEADSGVSLFQFDDQYENPERRLEAIQEELGLIEKL